MAFEFIDNAAIDRKTRKLIRSHAATGKGKNVEKKRRKQLSHGARKIVIARDSREDEDLGECTSDSQEVALPIETPISDGLFVVCFPTDLTPTSKVLFHRVFCFMSGPVYPVELSMAIDFTTASSIWVQNIFLDEAYFYCAAAMSAASSSSLFIGEPDSPEATLHLTRTLRLVNKKLSGDEALSDTTMSAIVAMTQYERLRGHYRQAMVHFEGLRRIVELRGGIANLVAHLPAIAQKIFRADLELAIHLGHATQLSLEHVPGFSALSSLRRMFDRGQTHPFHKSSIFTQLSLELQELVLDIGSLTWLLNNGTSHGTKLDGYTFHDTQLLIGYRLLHISRLGGPRPTNALENLVHLGLMSALAIFLRKLGGNLPPFTLLAELTRSAVQGHLDEDEEAQALLLWIMFIGRASIFVEADDIWLIPKIKRTKSALGFETWPDLRRAVSKYPWINALHDKPGQALWTLVTSNCNTCHTPPDSTIYKSLTVSPLSLTP